MRITALAYQLPKVERCRGCDAPLVGMSTSLTLMLPSVCCHDFVLDSNIEKCLSCGTETVRSKERREAVRLHMERYHPATHAACSADLPEQQGRTLAAWQSFTGSSEQAIAPGKLRA